MTKGKTTQRPEDEKDATAAPATYEAFIVTALDDSKILTERRLSVLGFLGQQRDAEQGHFWNRFSGFAAFHAGFLVVYSLVDDWPRAIAAWIGILLAVLWGAVQVASWRYVDRWKTPFHELRRQTNILWKHEWRDQNITRTAPSRLRKLTSSTTLALSAPALMLLAWVVLLYMSAGKH